MEAAAQGAGRGLKAKAAAPSEGSGSKTVMAPLARKPEAPKGLRKPSVPTNTSSSKVASKKAEAGS